MSRHSHQFALNPAATSTRICQGSRFHVLQWASTQDFEGLMQRARRPRFAASL